MSNSDDDSMPEWVAVMLGIAGGIAVCCVVSGSCDGNTAKSELRALERRVTSIEATRPSTPPLGGCLVVEIVDGKPVARWAGDTK